MLEGAVSVRGSGMESLETIQGQIQRCLCATALTEMSATFRELRCPAARVFFAYDLLKENCLFPHVINVEKCDVESEERRNYGNHVFVKLKKNADAVKHYNKAVAYAKSSEKLALAFANRSAVYFQEKLYVSCLNDINNALKYSLSVRVVEKLAERQKRAVSQMSGVEGPEDYCTETPAVSAKHPVIQCASDCVEMQCSDTLGRHVTATRVIHPGDVIAVEPPYTKVLLYNFYLTHCHNCLKPALNLIPCSKCPLTLYCSETCRETAWEKYHRYECTILDTLHEIRATKLQLLALRIVLTLGGHLAPDFPLNENKYTSGNYPEIHHLVTNEQHRTVSDLFARATVAATMIYLLEQTTFFTDCGDEKTARFHCALLLFKHLQTAPSNMHEISELQGSPSTGYEVTEIGAGAYAFLSLLNHSCCPNVVRHCHGSVVVLRAVKTIQKGEQLFDNYGYHFALMEKPERKSHLKEQYLFNCECEACVNDYPLYTDLSKGHNNFVVSEDELNELLSAKRSTALKLIPILLNNAEEFEKEPDEKRVEILDNQEVMKQCFAVLGNKNTLY